MSVEFSCHIDSDVAAEKLVGVLSWQFEYSGGVHESSLGDGTSILIWDIEPGELAANYSFVAGKTFKLKPTLSVSGYIRRGEHSSRSTKSVVAAILKIQSFVGGMGSLDVGGSLLLAWADEGKWRSRQIESDLLDLFVAHSEWKPFDLT